MAVDSKKEKEREEVHRAIWAIADELRGAVDGWDFKNYVLGTMFYRYISENLTAYINAGEIEAGNDGFDYARMSDDEAEEAREGLVEEKGFFILFPPKRKAVRLPGWLSAFFHDTIIHGIFHQIVPLFGQFAVADNSDLRYNEVGP